MKNVVNSKKKEDQNHYIFGAFFAFAIHNDTIFLRAIAKIQSKESRVCFPLYIYVFALPTDHNAKSIK